jgi:acyl carrier protein
MKELKQIIADFFGEDIKNISENTSQNNIEKWDSLLSINEIEKEYNITISSDDIIEINSVLDIRNILKKHNLEI